MKYMLLIYGPQRDHEPTPEEWAEAMPKWEAYTAELRNRGAYVDAAPLAGVNTATTVRVRDGKRVVTDGPFAESKEYLGGYYVVEAPTIDGALEAAAMCPGAVNGSIEVRPIVAM
jgi:hypothetical protein